MTLLKDLIEIPEHLDKGQFVLRLTEGVTDPLATVRSYVPTPQLVRCFDDALSFIRGSLQGAQSKATYLHGSFGSGKSHFMAILHLLLQGDPHARSLPELAEVIQKHNAWTQGKKFLLVPYHMIGAHDVESGILGGYVDFVRKTHPQAPIPGVYLAEGLFRDATALRAKMGDQKFFETLGDGEAVDEGFGDVDASWTAARFESALEADPGSDERTQLISKLIEKFFGSYDTQAGAHGEAFLSLDKGLSVISRHARDLGYDGLILFLDELILWLASHAADLKFVHQEGQKLAKLVEAQNADRPIPIVSFIARQRDLSELIGHSVPGADRLNFSDALKHWEGRFHKITLEDRNLPAIASKRVLRCRDEAARIQLDAAFEQTAKIRQPVMDVLLTTAGDREMFRTIYPFSPALVQTLIAVSSVLQRERTALKVMLQLLVEQRDVLTVGDILPVGDLFDVVAHGDEAFSQEMAIHFDNAKRLYHHKLLPMLERQFGRREELETLPHADPKRVAFRNNDRLIKTLLLSALVPEVESLRGLTAERLAALNHGTIKTPIPGRESQEVLQRCRNWAASVGEVRISEGSNPTISLQLSGVDTESIITQAQHEDSLGNRIRRIRQMLFDQLGVTGDGELQQQRDFLWKNTNRRCTVLFKNIRELPATSLENNDDDWKLIIDFPFDEAGHGPRDDLSKLQAFKETHPGGAKTLCWIPQFFSEDALKDLGLFVILEHILAGDRFNTYASHLSAPDKLAARASLESQHGVLRQRVRNHLDAAYGLTAIMAGSLDTAHAIEAHEQFVSLWPSFDPQPPVAAGLSDAFFGLLDQALTSEFPAAPDFEAEVKIGNLRKLHAVVNEAAQSADGRVLVEKEVRPLMRQIANPLKLGEMGSDSTHFVIGTHWKQHFLKKSAEAGRDVSVEMLRRWIDEPRAMGLPKEAQNLVILTYAEQASLSCFLHNTAVDVSLTSLPDNIVLKQENLPEPSQWEAAVFRAGRIFGEATSTLLKPSNVSRLSESLKRQAADHRAAAQSYVRRLRDRSSSLQVTTSDRLKTAETTWALIEKLHLNAPENAIAVLATATIATSESAMGECVKKCSQLDGSLESTNWELFEALGKLTDQRSTAAHFIADDVRSALSSDEHVVALGPALREAQSKALRLLTEKTPTSAPPPTSLSPQVEVTPVTSLTLPEPVAPGSPSGTYGTVSSGSRSDLAGAAAVALLNELTTQLKNGQSLQVSLSWTIAERAATPR